MKHFQITVLILVGITLLFSALSLAKTSETKEVKYGWYSQLSNNFVSDSRSTDGDEWLTPEKEKKVEVVLINNSNEYALKINDNMKKKYPVSSVDFSKFVMIQVKLLAPKPSGYRIKVSGILRMSNKIYFRISLNSFKNPENATGNYKYSIYDIVLIKKSDLGTPGNLKYIFKDQYGVKIASMN